MYRAGEIGFPGISRKLILNRFVSLVELRRHKRNFLKLSTTSSIFERSATVEQMRRMFVDYLAEKVLEGSGL